MIEDEKAERVETTDSPYRVRLPGFISDKDVGFGDLAKRVSYAIGIKPCRGCERRASVLNRWVVFTRRGK